MDIIIIQRRISDPIYISIIQRRISRIFNIHVIFDKKEFVCTTRKPKALNLCTYVTLSRNEDKTHKSSNKIAFFWFQATTGMFCSVPDLSTKTEDQKHFDLAKKMWRRWTRYPCPKKAFPFHLELRWQHFW